MAHLDRSGPTINPTTIVPMMLNIYPSCSGADEGLGPEICRNLAAAGGELIHTLLVQPSNMFERGCLAHGIEHKLTKPYHPWTNGQAERMNRTIKDATTKVFLPRSRKLEGSRSRLRRRLQLRQTPQSAAMANTV